MGGAWWFVAQTEQDYTDIAVTMASNPDRLAELRQKLRSSMAASRLCDRDGFKVAVEDASRTLWKKWCEEIESP